MPVHLSCFTSLYAVVGLQSGTWHAEDENGSLIFQAIACVASPRLASSVHSDLLFTLLDDFKNASLPLAVPTKMTASQQPTPIGSADYSR